MGAVLLSILSFSSESNAQEIPVSFSTELEFLFNNEIAPTLLKQNQTSFESEEYLLNDHAFDEWKDALNKIFKKIKEEYGSDPSIGNQWIFAITKILENSTSFNGVNLPFVITFFGPVEDGQVDWECIIHDEQRNFDYFPIRTPHAIEIHRGESKEEVCSAPTLPGKHIITISITDPDNKKIFHTKTVQQDVLSSWIKITSYNHHRYYGLAEG